MGTAQIGQTHLSGGARGELPFALFFVELEADDVQVSPALRFSGCPRCITTAVLYKPMKVLLDHKPGGARGRHDKISSRNGCRA